ncbi:MAG: hypothetical protein GXP32_06365 [Kiritimatiellaeota bacterium]|nr:hypothetical protein [Kiritimatiellota bacterium]
MRPSASSLLCVLISTLTVPVVFSGTISKKKADEFDKLYFPKIKKYSIRIECVSYERDFIARETPKMTFRIKNLSSKPLLIHEWFMVEEFNLKIYYTPWKKGMKKPEKEDWHLVSPVIPAKPKRMPLQLDAGNSVYVDKFLPFVAKMKLTEPKEFVIYVELNLMSIKKRSPYIKIKVSPPPLLAP